MANSTWDDAYHSFMENVMPQLEVHGRTIGQAAQGGDDLAGKVLQHYQLLARSFDPMSAKLVEDALNEWLATQTAKRATD